MTNTNDPIRQIFLAGVGALAIGAEKSQQVVEQLVKKGQITVDEGKEMSKDIASQAGENLDKVRDEIIAAHMKTMTKEQREAFAARVADMAANIDGNDGEDAPASEGAAEDAAAQTPDAAGAEGAGSDK